MTVYNPRRSPSRHGKGGGRKGGFGTRIGSLFRRRQQTVQHRSQPLVAGAQRVWKVKRLVRNLLIVVALLCTTAGMFWGALQLLVQSNVFRLSEIRVTGTQVTTERQILELAGLRQGGSLLRFDAGTAKARIKAHPWVERVEIKTQWPSAVEISISEFQPFALMYLPEGKEKRLRYVSRSGHAFAEVGQGQELDFPVITGVVPGKDLENGRFVKGSLAEAACTVLALAAKGNAILPIQAVSEVHLDPQRGLVLYLVDRPFPIYFGKDRLPMKYSRLVKILEQLYAKKQVDAVKEIRMDYLDDKVLVTGVQIDG